MAEDNNQKKTIDIKNRTFQFSLELIKLVDKLPRDSAVSIISNQLLRSGTSIGANIVEAKCASSRKDFINYYHIALKSANETRYWLLLLLYSKKYDSKLINPLLDELDIITRIIAKSIITLKSK